MGRRGEAQRTQPAAVQCWFEAGWCAEAQRAQLSAVQVQSVRASVRPWSKPGELEKQGVVSVGECWSCAGARARALGVSRALGGAVCAVRK